MPDRKHMQQSKGFLVVAILSVVVYANTLIGDFTFDDNFAVISNGDVTNNGNPIRDIFRHDFWGQDIASQQSHKSYRPITVLAFRWTRQAWDAVQELIPDINSQIPTPAPLLQGPKQDVFSGKSPRPPGLHPFPFHLLCIILHAVASMMVLALSQHMFAKLEQAASCTASSACAEVNSCSKNRGDATADTGVVFEWLSRRPRGLRSIVSKWLMWPPPQEALWCVPSSSRGRFQALAAGLLFALQPIHTEAVAGVVGCAELLCAVLSLPAMLLYCMAVDGRYSAAQLLQLHIRQSSSNTTAATRQNSGTRSGNVSKAKQQRNRQAATAASGPDPGERELYLADGLQHWLLVLAAAVLTALAALSKEIGITFIGTMVLYDLLLAPHMLGQQQQADSNSSRFRRLGFQVARLILMLVTAVGYVTLRSCVAVQQLVAIYRKVENPIPFAESLLTRIMSTGYLHTRYFAQLLLPLHLSADWSFNCIPLVEHVTDPRNAATLLLYGYLLWVLLSAQPLQLLRQLSGVAGGVLQSAAQTMAVTISAADTATTAMQVTPTCVTCQHRAVPVVSCARWRLMVVVGLLIAPFFPASNVLFYVGTFIGERLLYMPSIGFCLLLADLIGRLIPTAAITATSKDAVQEELSAADGNGKTAAAEAISCPSFSDWQKQPQQQQQATKTAAGAASHLPLLLLALLLVAYAGRTVVRNVDWWDEERLFLAAEKVCPNSAKVQQNCGVLQRRYQDFNAAMAHFRRAQEIEPGYCEPSYWIALTRINQGDVQGGLAAMKASLSCKYTATEALQTLNKLYLLMHEGTQSDPMPMVVSADPRAPATYLTLILPATPDLYHRIALKEWASVLASSAVLRVGDACATAEDAALLAAGVGKSSGYLNQVLDVCWQALRAWSEAEQQDPARDTMAGLARVRYRTLNTTLLHKCVKLRQTVYKKMSGHSPDSKAAKQAVYKYISRVQDQWPGCRTIAGGGVAGDDQDARIPSSHQKLLHRVQSADPEDPWLQLEWGQTLIALGGNKALKEAAMHTEVASALFTRLMQQLQEVDASTAHAAALRKLSQVTALDGSPLTPESSLEAAIISLEMFKQAAAAADDVEARGAYCEILKRLCHLRLQMVVLVQQLSTVEGGHARQEKALAAGLLGIAATKSVLNAKAAGRRCLLELSEQRGCETQAEEIRRMVGKG